jgi:hypothetical protein
LRGREDLEFSNDHPLKDNRDMLSQMGTAQYIHTQHVPSMKPLITPRINLLHEFRGEYYDWDYVEQAIPMDVSEIDMYRYENEDGRGVLVLKSGVCWASIQSMHIEIEAGMQPLMKVATPKIMNQVSRYRVMMRQYGEQLDALDQSDPEAALQALTDGYLLESQMRDLRAEIWPELQSV